MANTYTQIYMHVIFAVKGRESLIRPESLEIKNDILRHQSTKVEGSKYE